jgi:hypothetical protein
LGHGIGDTLVILRATNRDTKASTDTIVQSIRQLAGAILEVDAY